MSSLKIGKMNYRSKSKAVDKIIKLASLALLLAAFPLILSQVKKTQFFKSGAAGGNYYCHGCSRIYDHAFARFLSTTADCEGVVGSPVYSPSCNCSAPGKPLFLDNAEYKCLVPPYVCSGCVENKKGGSAKMFATWQSIYADCSVKTGSVHYSRDKYCAGSTRTSAPVPTPTPSQGSATIAANLTLNTPTYKLRFSPIGIKKSGNILTVRMRVPAYSAYNFYANVYLYAYPIDPISHVPVKRQQAFVKLSGLSDGQYHEYKMPFNASPSLLQVEEIYIVFANLPSVSCPDRNRENPCSLPMDIDYIRI